MPRSARRLASALLLLTAVLACSRSGPVRTAQRVGVPPEMLHVLEGGPDTGAGPIQYVALRPYDRARDLEVLLFASGSPVFSAIVMPGRWVPLLSAWVQPFRAKGFERVRPDVPGCLRSPGGLLALPITLDGILLVYRADLWKELRLPAPHTLTSLREAAIHLEARRPEMKRAIVSDVPVDQLFWGLAWSYEGQASPAVYSYPKLHALRFMKEFGLVPGPGPEPTGEQLITQGRSAALFCPASEARKLLVRSSPYSEKLRAVRIPAMQAMGHCIYAGWCLARPLEGGFEKGSGSGMAGEKYQGYLRDSGFVPVLQGEALPGDDISSAFSATVFHPPPDLGEGGDEVVMGAILDAAQGPVDAEEALRRAEARIKRRAG